MFALSSDTFLDILGDLELSPEEGADRLLHCYTDHCDCPSLFFGVFPRRWGPRWPKEHKSLIRGSQVLDSSGSVAIGDGRYIGVGYFT